MAARPSQHDGAPGLALAVVASSATPLLLLNGELTVVAASASFCDAFHIDPESAAGQPIFALGTGEWNVPRLRSLLTATASGGAEVDAYEMDLAVPGGEARCLVFNARKLDYGDAEHVWLLLAVADVTEARIAEKLNSATMCEKDTLLREKAILLQEVQHRVANSLQIIASVLLQSARKVQSEETRGHLHDAHNRVMSIAALQKQLAASSLGEVALDPYLTQLCHSIGASMIRDHHQLSLEVTADRSVVEPDVSVSLGLIVTELVINALKHAFPGRRHGKIKVDYRADGFDWTLSVSDNGVGMPTNPDAAAPGLGTSIVEALARQLRADVQVRPGNPGTTVSIVHSQAAAAANDQAVQMPPEPQAVLKT